MRTGTKRLKRVTGTVVVWLLITTGGLAGAFDTKQQETNTIPDILQHSKRVLWLGAHPDDETSSSALLARAKDMPHPFGRAAAH